MLPHTVLDVKPRTGWARSLTGQAYARSQRSSRANRLLRTRAQRSAPMTKAGPSRNDFKSVPEQSNVDCRVSAGSVVGQGATAKVATPNPRTYMHRTTSSRSIAEFVADLCHERDTHRGIKMGKTCISFASDLQPVSTKCKYNGCCKPPAGFQVIENRALTSVVGTCSLKLLVSL